MSVARATEFSVADARKKANAFWKCFMVSLQVESTGVPGKVEHIKDNLYGFRKAGLTPKTRAKL
jgi:hypothetical protein